MISPKTQAVIYRAQYHNLCARLRSLRTAYAAGVRYEARAFHPIDDASDDVHAFECARGVVS